jgi:hypothetical protein
LVEKVETVIHVAMLAMAGMLKLEVVMEATIASSFPHQSRKDRAFGAAMVVMQQPGVGMVEMAALAAVASPVGLGKAVTVGVAAMLMHLEVVVVLVITEMVIPELPEARRATVEVAGMGTHPAAVELVAWGQMFRTDRTALMVTRVSSV